MFNQPHSFLSSSTSEQNVLWLKTALLVIVLHLGVLGIGIFWHPTPPASKPRSKVLVQTLSLKPIQSTAIQNLPSPPQMTLLPKEQPIPEPLPLIPTSLPLIAELVKENDPLIQEEISTQKEISLKEESLPKSVEKAVPIPQLEASFPLPIKAENLPQPTPIPSKPPTKPVIQEVKKKVPEKKAAPVKQPIEKTKKPAKTEGAKPKIADDLEKKRQQEKTEIEKKRQQEKAEVEKKRQKEKAEAELERKRQQELAEAQEAAKQRELTLLNKAKENLAKMGETRDKISTSSSLSLKTTEIPKELESLQVDALPIGEVGGTEEWGVKELSYSSEVASRLKLALRLPDYGAVKIKLTLDRTGKVIKVNIVHSESHKNKSYVESKIPTLLFPSFGQRFQGLSQKTFEISLQNDS